MLIFGTKVDNEADNQVEYLDTETNAMVRMGPRSKPPGIMDKLNECSVALNNNQIVHIQEPGHLDIFDIRTG